MAIVPQGYSLEKPIIMMTPDEARECVSRIHSNLSETRELLLELHDREGWRALGYSTWQGCVEGEFKPWSREHVRRQLNAARIELQLVADNATNWWQTETKPIPEYHLRPLTKIESEQGRREAWENAQERADKAGEELAAKHVYDAVEDHLLINQSLGTPAALQMSESNEWYTPTPYIEAARRVMGSIDLDPASCEYANRVVRAGAIFTIDDDGFSRPWHGKVWLNPPYGYRENNESNQAAWSAKLIDEYSAGHIEQACLLVNAVPGNRWFAPLWDFHICFPDHRIRFYNQEVEAGQPTHSNAIVYIGRNVDRFVREFSRFGVVAKKVLPDE